MDTTREGRPVKGATVATPPAPQPKEVPGWRTALPHLRGRHVLLREPAREDAAALWALITPDLAPRFGIVECLSDEALSGFIDRARQARANGQSFTYVITAVADGTVTGLLQVRQLDATFETSECECVIRPRLRGRDALMEAAHLAGAFAFDTVGARRIEARVPLQDRHANSTLRKLGAMQEAVLRRSMRQGAEYVDQALWALMKEDWHSAHGGFTSRWIH